MQTTILQTNTYFRSSLLSEIGLARKRRNGWHDERARRSKAGRGRSKRLSQIWSTEIFENGKNYYHTLQNRPFLSRFLGKRRQARSERGARDARDRGGGAIVFLRDTSSTRGSPSSKCKHRRTSTLLHTRENLVAYHSNYKDLYGKKNLRKWKDFNKKQLTLHKVCVTSLLCVPWADLWPFNGLYCKRFSLCVKVPVFFGVNSWFSRFSGCYCLTPVTLFIIARAVTGVKQYLPKETNQIGKFKPKNSGIHQR